MRRSFRMGLWLGLLAGVLVAVFKVVQTRRDSGQEWDLPEPAWPRAEPEPMPTPGEAGDVDDLDEPGPLLPEPIPEAEPVPVAPPAPATPAPTLDTAPVDAPPAEPSPVEEVLVEPAPVEPATAVEPAPRKSVARKSAARKSAARKAVARKATKKSVAKKAVRAVKAAGRTPAKKAAATAATASKRTAKKAGKKAAKAAKKAVAVGQVWVEPQGGICPATHPVKAKLASGLFHLPGMAFYDLTMADRCYRDEASAVRDGLTRSSR